MNEILTMNSRSPRRKFVFFCCVTLLELIDKKTFGINKDSPQGQESKRFSLFYKVKEGMLRKLLHDPSNFVLQFVSQFTCARQNLFSLCISRKGKGIPHISFVRFLRPPFRKEQVSYDAGRGNA